MIDPDALRKAMFAYERSMLMNDPEFTPIDHLREAIVAYGENLWKPIESMPEDGTFWLVRGLNNHVGSKYRMAICQKDPLYHPLRPIIDEEAVAFADGGPEATHYRAIP